MKAILLSVLFALSQTLFAQTAREVQQAELRQNAKQIRVQEHSGTPSFIRFRDNYSITPEKALEYSKSFFTSNNAGFRLKNEQKSKNTKQVYRYEQTIADYPVEFSAWNIHVKNSRVISMNGEIVDAPKIDVTFLLSEHEALQAALKYMGAELYMWQDKNEELLLKRIFNNSDTTYYPSGTKVITPIKPELKHNKLRTAYRFNIFSKKPYNRKMVYVDAQTGEILFDLPLIHFSSETGTAHTQYSGVRQITTEYFDDDEVYVLSDTTRGKGIETVNCMDGIDYINAEYFMDDDNVWNNVNEEQDEYATDAHFATISTYDYYNEIHGRNSIDDAGYPLISVLHFDLVEAGIQNNNVNAFWAGFMVYGDGEQSMGITPLTAIDICGHEISHGLTQLTANLVYQNESGALNEGFSDIFGTAIEFYAVPENADWLIGEDIGYTMRSMENPNEYNLPDTYKGDYWEFGSYDNGGVHINSSVLNYWFYLLCEGGTGTNDHGNAYEVTPIGMAKAEQIAFKLLTEYLSPTSQFYDACYYAIEAANELYGNCSPETQAVSDAFYAVGVIDEPFVITVTSDFSGSETEFCKVPAEVTFTNNSAYGVSYLWDFGDGNTSTDFSPTHVYEQLGNYTVTLTVDGGGCGSTVETKEDYIKANDTLPCATVMLANGTLNIEECEGVVYDSGGANQNYTNSANSRLIIHSPGAAKITLDIEEFDIESSDDCSRDYIAFYDGNSINAPLINNTRYCADTGNPGNISSTGEYITIHFVSDRRNTTYAGYKIAFHCVPAVKPEADFTVNTQNSCNGRIEFIDQSANAPKSWMWDFGDGSISSLQNPVHQYLNNGVYTVSLTVENAAGDSTLRKEELLTVNMSEAPHIDDIVGSRSSSFDVVLNLEGTACWYQNLTDDEPLYIGNHWTHPPLTSDTVYYLREVFTTSRHVGEDCASMFATVRFFATSAVGSSQLENINITPNPSAGLFAVHGLTAGIGHRYSVTDILGNTTVATQPLSETRLIDLTTFPAGIYFIQIESSKGKTVRKVIKN